MNLALFFLTLLFACASYGGQWMLPDELLEVSGLARESDEQLLLRDDERAIVYRMDVISPKVIVEELFSIGSSAVKADFEGIAIVDYDVLLLTSDSQLYTVKDVLVANSNVAESRSFQ